jgi:hypothetical protein
MSVPPPCNTSRSEYNGTQYSVECRTPLGTALNGIQNVSGSRRQGSAHYVSIPSHRNEFTPLPPLVAPPGFEDMTFEEDLERYRVLLEDLERRENPAPLGHPDENDSDEDNDDDPPSTSCLMAVPSELTSQPMPHHHLPSVFPTRPLNLNDDGTPINYRKSHSGQHAAY